MANSSHKRKVGAVASYAYTLTSIVVNLLYVPLLLGGIGRAEYGLYQMVGSVIAYLGTISTILSAGVTRYYCNFYAAGDEDGMRRTLGVVTRIYRWATVGIAVVSLVVGVVFRVVYVGALTPWQLDESLLMLAILAVNVVLTMNNTISIAAITAHEEFVFLRLTNRGVQVAQPVLVLILIHWFPVAATVCLCQLLTNGVQLALQHGYARERLGMQIARNTRDAELTRQIFAFTGGIVLGVIADQIFWHTDQLILGYLYGPAVVAVYAVGAQVVTAYHPLGTAVSSVFMPRISELCQTDEGRAQLPDLFCSVGRVTLYPLLLVLTGFVVFGREFVVLWAGPDYASAWVVALILITPFTIDLCQNIALTILQVLNKYQFRAVMYLVAAILNVGLTIVLAQLFGGIGAAVATAIAIVCSSGVIMNWYYQTRIGLHVGHFWAQVARMAAPIAVLCTVAWLVKGLFPPIASWGALIVGVLVYTALYGCVAYMFSANEAERGLVRGLVRRIRGSK